KLSVLARGLVRPRHAFVCVFDEVSTRVAATLDGSRRRAALRESLALDGHGDREREVRAGVDEFERALEPHVADELFELFALRGCELLRLAGVEFRLRASSVRLFDALLRGFEVR